LHGLIPRSREAKVGKFHEAANMECLPVACQREGARPVKLVAGHRGEHNHHHQVQNPGGVRGVQCGRLHNLRTASKCRRKNTSSGTCGEWPRRQGERQGHHRHHGPGSPVGIATLQPPHHRQRQRHPGRLRPGRQLQGVDTPAKPRGVPAATGDTPFPDQQGGGARSLSRRPRRLQH
jgi:hypothetical protein